MNANGILKTFLNVLGRNPLSETHPQVSLYLAFESAPVEYPALVADVTLEAVEPLGNRSVNVTATFTLVVDAADFENEEIAEMIEATDAALYSRLTVPALNLHAEEIGAPVHFYHFRWNSSASPDVRDEGKLAFLFEFTGKAQF